MVRKGDWLRTMGVGDAVDFVGTKDSVAIRVPDSAVLSYLVSIAGPIAITSANPSGEPDSTHHDTVIDTLGKYYTGQYTGPIAITSANPSGETYSTQHQTVIDTLGKHCTGRYAGPIATTTQSSTHWVSIALVSISDL